MDNVRYIGDDLINLITITVLPEEGSELPEIEAVEVRIGCFQKKFVHPTNPFTIDVLRKDSAKLSIKNPCYAAIWYWGVIDGERTLLKKTCEGTITLSMKQEVIHGCKC